MRIAVYSLTRDRLDYTKHCFTTLQRRAGIPFHHFVIDNGSQDGTVDWLTNEYAPRWGAANKYPNRVSVYPMGENLGISKASNFALDEIGIDDYDLTCKIDNDCEVVYPTILARIARFYENIPPLAGGYMVSPRVEGINKQPTRARETMIDDVRLGIVGLVGGLFHVVPTQEYWQFRYNTSLAKARGQDEQVCAWFRNRGGHIAYMEDLIVNHYETTDGQAQRYPEYFERKWKEEAV